VRARYYSPGLGRFNSVDPAGESMILGLPMSFNRYSYVLNRSANLTDPDGRCVIDLCIVESLLVLTGVGMVADAWTRANPGAVEDLGRNLDKLFKSPPRVWRRQPDQKGGKNKPDRPGGPVQDPTPVGPLVAKQAQDTYEALRMATRATRARSIVALFLRLAGPANLGPAAAFLRPFFGQGEPPRLGSPIISTSIISGESGSDPMRGLTYALGSEPGSHRTTLPFGVATDSTVRELSAQGYAVSMDGVRMDAPSGPTLSRSVIVGNRAWSRR
jgi:hypothetical protein